MYQTVHIFDKLDSWRFVNFQCNRTFRFYISVYYFCSNWKSRLVESRAYVAFYCRVLWTWINISRDNKRNVHLSSDWATILRRLLWRFLNFIHGCRNIWMERIRYIRKVWGEWSLRRKEKTPCGYFDWSTLAWI